MSLHSVARLYNFATCWAFMAVLDEAEESGGIPRLLVSGFNLEVCGASAASWEVDT